MALPDHLRHRGGFLAFCDDRQGEGLVNLTVISTATHHDPASPIHDFQGELYWEVEKESHRLTKRIHSLITSLIPLRESAAGSVTWTLPTASWISSVAALQIIFNTSTPSLAVLSGSGQQFFWSTSA
ncbi:unnamed protein product [Clonostachys rosea f. rosea IK726]|uniref:Uncharacterized protein n=1 Tax=Clonostachys rosea f. rosea IK726 TaxID=1349383 RepID=A0ACA9UEG6_BIOOC|nr:unnamed protein product [Clonostachys rosea f. rosea IK726]